MAILNEEFQKKLLELYGQSGEEWAASLPDLLAKCEARFAIALDTAFSNLSWNLLVRASTNRGEAVVLKVGVLREELARESRVLHACKGLGAVRVLDFDDDLGAMVLERAVPGTPLSQCGDDDAATGIFCDVFAKLHGEPRASFVDCPTIEEHFAAIHRYQQKYPQGDGPLPTHSVDFAAHTLQKLVCSTPQPSLLHADLHHDNILSHGSDWIFIDPKGVVGDIHFDTIQYLLNYPTRGADAETVLARRIDIMSQKLGLEAERIVLWGVTRGVLEACWGLEGTNDGMDGMAIASLFSKLLEPRFSLE